MLVRNHTAINEALMTTVLISTHTPPVTSLIILTGVYYGSLLPDIDHKFSPLLTTIDHLGFHRCYQWCCDHFKHRTITHSIYALIIIALIYLCSIHSLILNLWLLGIFVGYALHLYEDWWSLQSIPFFMPKPTHRPRHRYRVGNPFENWLGLISRCWWYLLIITKLLPQLLKLQMKG